MRDVSIDDTQFGFGPDHNTTDAIFNLLQLQENYLLKKHTYIKRVFGRILRDIDGLRET